MPSSVLFLLAPGTARLLSLLQGPLAAKSACPGPAGLRQRPPPARPPARRPPQVGGSAPCLLWQRAPLAGQRRRQPAAAAGPEPASQRPAGRAGGRLPAARRRRGAAAGALPLQPAACRLWHGRLAGGPAGQRPPCLQRLALCRALPPTSSHLLPSLLPPQGVLGSQGQLPPGSMRHLKFLNPSQGTLSQPMSQPTQTLSAVPWSQAGGTAGRPSNSRACPGRPLGSSWRPNHMRAHRTAAAALPPRCSRRSPTRCWTRACWTARSARSCAPPTSVGHAAAPVPLPQPLLKDPPAGPL